jgi:hypothetical protein
MREKLDELLLDLHVCDELCWECGEYPENNELQVCFDHVFFLILLGVGMVMHEICFEVVIFVEEDIFTVWLKNDFYDLEELICYDGGEWSDYFVYQDPHD